MANFNNQENVILHACASVTGKSIADIIGSKKTKDVVMARALTCATLAYYGFGVREISRITNTDVKGVSSYMDGHQDRLSDNRYKSYFLKCINFIATYEDFSSEAIADKINVLYKKYIELEGRYDHLKELLINN
jgi:hypothetical protein